MSRISHILLVALVLVCPLWCVVGNCACSEVVAEAIDLCCCNSQPDDSDCPSPDQPEKVTQCICGGAVLADDFEVEQSDSWTAFFVDNTQGWQLGIQSESIGSNPGLLENPVVSGRMLRHLHSSLTL